MYIKSEDLPVMLQAFELHNGAEIFVAEQLVHSQAEVDNFTAAYAGKIIKASKETGVLRDRAHGNVTKKRNPVVGFIMITLVVVLLALIIYGFSTGWIQEKFNLNI
ncbi:MAG: hypothetical protein EOO03_03425 [Chitinophagaceae bacterium]|nr:MAG: hypothetical protein EOO03_03425 [Chitinophagaceae bacterium]